MTRDTGREFGKYLQGLRHERKLSMRELARIADIDSGGLTRIENGQIRPWPDTLKSLASALDVPLSDLFAMAGYITPSDLPSMSTYLRVCYSELPAETCVRVEEYVQRLVNEHDLDAGGPAEFEDEIDRFSKE